MTVRRLRCAVYTRKSTDEGLDQDFNSLDAQRDACEAYIKSQASEGWTVLKARYDDGGFSGGSMERPALQRLLVDIRDRKVDVVVVYKVDRLTRSLADFAKIVEILDGQGVSFVSVTQQFNTTSSMGRLTLNVLLSFAQFEREVTAERIRDKIAASKKKGMWMGGVVPLGYDVIDRKLIVNPREAETVRTVFDLYRRFGTIRAVQEEADHLGLRTKARKPNNGSRPGGARLRPGHINKLLNNRIYIGEITHKGESYPGEHEPIIDRDVWDAVQARMAENAPPRSHGVNGKSTALLAGLLHDEDGARLIPHHSNKKGRRYRYYISRDPASRTGWRLPAKTIETAVIDGLIAFLRDRRRMIDALGQSATATHAIEAILSKAGQLGEHLRLLGPGELRVLLLDLVYRVDITREHLCIVLRVSTLRAKLDIPESEGIGDDEGPTLMNIELPARFRRRGVETKLVVGGVRDKGATPDRALITAVTSARRWFDDLKTGSVRSIKELATKNRVDRGDVSRILPLAFLAPDIIEAILDGRQPVELTAYRLKRLRHLPYLWSEQRRLLGFIQDT